MKRPTSRAQPAAKLSEHIRELQKRLIVSVLALLLAGVLVYAFYEPIIEILRSPLGAPLYYTSPVGSFSFVMKICLAGAIAVAMPVLVYNMVMFVRPAFKEALSLKRVYLTAFASSILAAAGVAFGFWVILPKTLHFFGGYQVGGLSALISADSYLNFVVGILVTFIIAFQLPLLVSFIDIIKPLSPKKMLGYEKWAILGSLTISLLVPFSFDLSTSLLVSLPIFVLFNLSIIIVALRHAAIRRKERSNNHKAFNTSLKSTSPVPSFNNLSFESLTVARELDVPAKPVPATVKPATFRAGMDIRPPVRIPSRHIATAKPQRPQAQTVPLRGHVNLISDFNRVPRPSRALTSQ